ncbi:uncharacterized protein LOC119414241 [Nematolebias whitei]|uniref:uncharacterized protein LOC119414241 n=1 Tax=Nematolebias whitei TaxID=451745 RepID=UPI0018977768|nr:uncharacterized protein LOC119414241 [Nematolebias whitei]
MFKASIADVAYRSCGLKVTGACWGSNQRTHWSTPAVMEGVKLKKEAFRTWLFRRTPDAADRYMVARRTMASTVLGLGGELLTRTEDIIEQWKDHFEDLLNPPTMSTFEEAEPEDSGEAPVPDHQTADCAAISVEEQQLIDKGSPMQPECLGRGDMEERYETFEEELWPPRADAPPQKPVRQIRRPEMYTSRKFREEVAPVPQQPKSEPKMFLKEPSFSKPTSLQKSLSIQSLTQIETPWENVTLNRCLLVAITILVLTSGFQRLHETFRSRGTADEEAGLTTRRSGMIRHRGQHPEPETSLWEVMFWWLPDLDDDEEEEDDAEIKRRKSKTGGTARVSRGLRHRSLPDKKLLKQRDGKLKDRRAKKARDNKIKDKKEKMEEHEEAADEEDERREHSWQEKYDSESQEEEITK